MVSSQKKDIAIITAINATVPASINIHSIILPLVRSHSAVNYGPLYSFYCLFPFVTDVTRVLIMDSVHKTYHTCNIG